MSETRKYMKFEDVKLKQPLLSVKRSWENTNTILIIPENFVNTMCKFFDQENLYYEVIEDPALYPRKKLNEGLQRFEDLDAAFSYENPVLFITQFDPDALFEWTTQLYGKNPDPSYKQYRNDRRAAAEEYYHKYEE